MLNVVNIPTTIEVDVSETSYSFPDIGVCYIARAVSLGPIFGELDPRQMGFKAVPVARSKPIQVAKIINELLEGYSTSVRAPVSECYERTGES